jgi:hypothetical protein
MKKLTRYLIVSLFALPIMVQACPNLAGEYLCLIEDGHREPWLDLMTIQQSTQPDSPHVTNFITHYRSIPDGEDTFSADEAGISDGWGWIIKCTGDKVVSLRNDYSAISELYLDKADNLVRTYNYKIQQTCSRKN